MKRFKKVYVEITNICNLNCSFCPPTKRAKVFMSIQNFEKIAEEISKYTSHIYLHIKGEPLLHPQLDEILKLCARFGLKVNISTNGFLLKDKLDELLVGNIRQLNISLHSFEGTGNEEGLKKYLEEVIISANILAKTGCNIRYKLWNVSEDIINHSTLFVMHFFEKNYGVEIEDVKFEKDIKLGDNIYISFDKQFDWPDMSLQYENSVGGCYGLKEQIGILVDGTVVPCCLDNNGDISLGNIFKNTLGEILESERAKSIIQGFNNGRCVEELCRKCGYKNKLKCNKGKNA